MNGGTATFVGIGVGVGLALIVAFAASGSKGKAPSGSSNVRPGYTIRPSCKGLDVTDEAAAEAYAVAEGAAAPSAAWPQRIMLRLFGPTCAALTPAEALAIIQAEPAVEGFVYRLLRWSLQGAVKAGRFTAQQAQDALDNVRKQAAAAGLDVAVLVPELLED